MTASIPYPALLLLLLFALPAGAQQPATGAAGHTDKVKAALFSADSKTAVTMSFDHTARIWEVATGKLLAELALGSGMPKQLALTPGGRQVVIATAEKLTIWQLPAGRLLHQITLPDEGTINTFALNRTGRLIAIGATFTAYVYELATGRLLHRLNGFSEDITVCAFSPADDKLLLASDWEQTKQVWDGASGQLLFPLQNNEVSTATGSFTPDGKWIITASKDSLLFWHAANGQRGFSLPAAGFVKQLAFNPADGAVGVVTTEGFFEWNWAQRKQKVSLPLSYDILGLSYHPKGRQVAICGKSDSVLLYDIAQRKTSRVFRAHADEWIFTASFNAGGDKIITASYDKTAKIWEASSGRLLRTLPGGAGSRP